MNNSQESYSFLCVGDLGVDIFSSPIARSPDPGKQVMTENIAVYPGGNALNTAIALHRLGERVAIAGSVGADALGNLLVDELREIGLDFRGVRQEPEGSTAATFIFRLHGEDRRFIHSPGVGAGFSGEFVSPELIPDQGVVLIAGYLKLGAWDDKLLIDFLRQVRSRNCRVVLNVSLVQGSGVDPIRCTHLLDQVDIFVLNQDEAFFITNESEPSNQALALRRSGARTVVITRGTKGLYAVDGKNKVEMGIFPVSQVDPSGCGDCFTAGMLYSLHRGWDLIRILEFGSAVGALGATALGCTNGVPQVSEVERFLTEHKTEITVRKIRN